MDFHDKNTSKSGRSVAERTLLNAGSRELTRSTINKERPQNAPFPLFLAKAEGFEPPCPCGQTVFKFYPSFVACRLLLLFDSPNCRKISVLTALLSDNSGLLLCLGIVSHSLSLLVFSAFSTAFCRDLVDVLPNSISDSVVQKTTGSNENIKI